MADVAIPSVHAVQARVSDALQRAAAHVPTFGEAGLICEAVGTVLKARGIDAHVGEICELFDPGSRERRLAEVVGFSGTAAILMPFGDLAGLSAETEVHATGRPHGVPVGDAMLGRVVDGFGAPLDGQPLRCSVYRRSRGPAPQPLSRERISRPLITGIRVIDALATIAQGQRVGIFSPAGLGKSTLLGLLARQAQCDVRVIALIGERGREIGEFIEFYLGKAGLAQSVVVAATSDRSPVERVNAAHTATAIAEHFRDAGKSVLLLFDSMTRLARAQREVGLAAGEPPARQGFPPSVFSALPQLVERAGCGAKGSITAFYAVLMEGEVGSDPIADELRAILDGHLVLTHKLAQRGQYPALDPLQSISRVMPLVTSAAHQGAALRLRALLSKYEEIEMLVQLGEYQPKTDPDGDEALAKMGDIRAFLAQRPGEATPPAQTLQHLRQLVNV